MRPHRILRTGLLLMLVAGLLAFSELKGAPRLTVQSPTALYLLAQYRLAVGDASSGVELMDRALAGRDSLPVRADGLRACNLSPAVATP
jgi:hypothetical protein